MLDRLTPESLVNLLGRPFRVRKHEHRIGQWSLLRPPQAFGDCRCGHSVAYHLPLVGCMKCGCDEFR